MIIYVNQVDEFALHAAQEPFGEESNGAGEAPALPKRVATAS
jgi:hypothetical protein